MSKLDTGKLQDLLETYAGGPGDHWRTADGGVILPPRKALALLCSHEHFRLLGIELRRKARKVWGQT